jgi:hypothetical protein
MPAWRPFEGKPIAIMGAPPRSPGIICGILNGMLLNRSEVMIFVLSTRFDEQGNLTDGATREYIQKLPAAWGRTWFDCAAEFYLPTLSAFFYTGVFVNAHVAMLLK